MKPTKAHQKDWTRLFAEGIVDALRRDCIVLVYDKFSDKITIAARDGDTISPVNMLRIKMVHKLKDAVKQILKEDVTISLKWNHVTASLIGVSESSGDSEFLGCVKGLRIK